MTDRERALALIERLKIALLDADNDGVTINPPYENDQIVRAIYNDQGDLMLIDGAMQVVPDLNILGEAWELNIAITYNDVRKCEGDKPPNPSKWSYNEREYKE